MTDGAKNGLIDSIKKNGFEGTVRTYRHLLNSARDNMSAAFAELGQAQADFMRYDEYLAEIERLRSDPDLKGY